jgi:hypothetical protein
MTRAQRLHAATLTRELYAHRARFGYPPGDQRTARDNISWHLTEQEMMHALETGSEPVQLDCSETWPWVLRCCGAWHWSGPGWTGSHLETLTVYHDARAAGIAAGVVFGPGDGHHEGWVLEPDPHGGNPLLGSHGEPGFDIVRLYDLAASQAAEGYPGVRFLSVAHL